MDKTLFRNVVQVGMVVSDLDQTLEKFQSLLGIRPFRTVEYPPVGEEGCPREYRGKSGDFTARFCFFNLGGIELEVIQPLTGDSIWSDFPAASWRKTASAVCSRALPRDPTKEECGSTTNTNRKRTCPCASKS